MKRFKARSRIVVTEISFERMPKISIYKLFFPLARPLLTKELIYEMNHIVNWGYEIK